jgi:hypothetical protein
MRHSESKSGRAFREDAPSPAHRASAQLHNTLRDALACVVRVLSKNGLCMRALSLFCCCCVLAAQCICVGWRAPPSFLCCFLFCCEVRVHCVALLVYFTLFACDHELLRSPAFAKRAPSTATSDVHFRGSHSTLNTSGATNDNGLLCAVAQEKRKHLKSTQERIIRSCLAIVDKSYRRNSCLHSSSHDRDAERAQRKYNPIAWTKFAMDRQMEITKKPFPSLGHCWRAALLAVFRLIVIVGFVSGCKLGTLPIGCQRLAPQFVSLASRDRDLAISSLSAQRAYVANAWISR